MRTDLVELLRCPACGSVLTAASDGSALTCQTCHRSFPIIEGIPRFVEVPDDAAARRTQASFGYEWTHFNDWSQSAESSFKDYFAGLDLAWLHGRTVLDAGCGMGRHAREMAQHAGRVVALDFSRAIDQAAHNTRASGNVDCLQADLLVPPVADATFDYVYSVGVLHHTPDCRMAFKRSAALVAPGGRFSVWLWRSTTAFWC